MEQYMFLQELVVFEEHHDLDDNPKKIITKTKKIKELVDIILYYNSFHLIIIKNFSR